MATSQRNYTEQIQQHQLSTALKNVDIIDMTMSFRVTSASERHAAVLISPQEIKQRVYQLRNGNRFQALSEGDTLDNVLQYSNAIQTQLYKRETRTAESLFSYADHNMSPISFDICRTYSTDQQPLISVMLPKPRESRMFPIEPSSKLNTTAAPQNLADWRRPNYALLNKQQIIKVLAKLPKERRQQELRVIERKALRGSLATQRIGLSSLLISPISGMLHSTPRRRVSTPDMGYRRQRRSQLSVEPQLGRRLN